MTFAADLTREIAAGGPIAVADYMRRANAHYYATRDPLGAQGDFTTAPEISQIFGELLGAWAADQWHRLSSPPAILCELGPGRGTLMQDALRATRNVPGFHDCLEIVLVENSPALRSLQKKALQNAAIGVHRAETLETLSGRPLLLIANEFFDALPVRQFVRDGAGETERKITHDGTQLVWQPEGDVVREDSPLSCETVQRIAEHVVKFGGAALIIDYGYYESERGDTLQAVSNHEYCDPLSRPGEVDLTAHVDFAALARAARNAGACVHGPVEQGVFLKRLGAELRAIALCKAASPPQREAIVSGLERLVAPEQMGALFKVMAVTDTLDKPAGF